MSMKGNLPPENALVHSAARGERSNVIIIDQISTHHNKIQSRACTKMFKGNLSAENAFVNSAGSGERSNVIVIDQIITHHKFSLNTKSMLSTHKHVYSKETYLLRVNQFTRPQVGN